MLVLPHCNLTSERGRGGERKRGKYAKEEEGKREGRAEGAGEGPMQEVMQHSSGVETITWESDPRVLLLPLFLLFFEQITPTPAPKTHRCSVFKMVCLLLLPSSSLEWPEKVSGALVLSHTITKMKMAQGYKRLCGLKDIKKITKTSKVKSHIEKRRKR